jgi:hypothetical protein
LAPNSLSLLAGLALLVAGCASPQGARGHAHNDYVHKRALHDALAAGCSSVEADIFLIDGALRVGHERFLLRDGTLQSLYLDPLREIVVRNGGYVQSRGERFWLLIDIKAESAAVYAELRRVLADYRDMLTGWRDGVESPGAITIVLSGDRPRAQAAAERERYVAIDGRLRDLEDNPPPTLVPWISDAWSTAFAWNGKESMPDDQRAKLRAIAAQAHAQGRMLRLWGTPDRPEVWEELAAAAVDWISTDRLTEFANWNARR